MPRVRTCLNLRGPATEVERFTAALRDKGEAIDLASLERVVPLEDPWGWRKADRLPFTARPLEDGQGVALHFTLVHYHDVCDEDELDDFVPPLGQALSGQWPALEVDQYFLRESLEVAGICTYRGGVRQKRFFIAGDVMLAAAEKLDADYSDLKILLHTLAHPRDGADSQQEVIGNHRRCPDDLALAALRRQIRLIESDPGRYPPGAPATDEALCEAICETEARSEAELAFVSPPYLTNDVALTLCFNNEDNWAELPEALMTQAFWDEFLAWHVNRLRVGDGLQRVPRRFRTAEILDFFCKNDPSALECLGADEATATRLKRCLKCSGSQLKSIPPEARTAELCRLAIKSHGGALRHVPPAHRTRELCELAVRDWPGAIGFVPPEVCTREFLCAIEGRLKINALFPHQVPPALRTLAFFDVILPSHPILLPVVPPELLAPLLADPDFMARAMRRSGRQFDWALNLSQAPAAKDPVAAPVQLRLFDRF